MDVLPIPAVALFTGMIVSFAVIMMFVTIGDVIKTD